MYTGVRIIISIILVMLLSACATKSAEDIFVESQGLQPMTSERLQTVLDGNTIQWGDGTNVYYSGSEIRALDSGGGPMVGTIDFSDNLHCRAWGGEDKCSSVYEDSDGKLTFFVDGKFIWRIWARYNGKSGKPLMPRYGRLWTIAQRFPKTMHYQVLALFQFHRIFATLKTPFLM